MLFAEILLCVVEENATTPEKEDGALDELLLDVVRVLDDLTEVVWLMQYRSLNTQLHVADGIGTRLNQFCRVISSFTIILFL